MPVHIQCIPCGCEYEWIGGAWQCPSCKREITPPVDDVVRVVPTLTPDDIEFLKVNKILAD